MNAITVRDMQPNEITCVARLHDQIHALHVAGRPDLFAPTCEDASGLMLWHQSQPNRRVLVAVSEEIILGYAVISYNSRSGSPYMQPRRSLHVEEICVDASCRRNGAGSALMAFIYQDARNRSYPRVELDVWDFNEDAQQFYRSIGMTEYRHFLEHKVFPHRFARLSHSQAMAAIQLYNSLKGLPGCTWDEDYPCMDIIKADIEKNQLFGAFDEESLIAVGAALPDRELTHLTCWTVPAENPCILSRIGVAMDRQGHGLAGQMVRYMEEEMRLAGFDTARMLVSPGNKKALRAYGNCDYQECGSARMYEEDWLCFEKRLI